MNLNLYMGDSEEKHLPRLNSVHGINPIYPDQDPRCLSSQTMVGLHSRGSPQWFCSCSVVFPINPSIFSDSIAIVPISSWVMWLPRSVSSGLCSYWSLESFLHWFWCFFSILAQCLLQHAFSPWAPSCCWWLYQGWSLVSWGDWLRPYSTSSWVAHQPLWGYSQKPLAW